MVGREPAKVCACFVFSKLSLLTPSAGENCGCTSANISVAEDSTHTSPEQGTIIETIVLVVGLKHNEL